MYKLQIGCLIILLFIAIIFGLMNKKKSRMHRLFGTILLVGIVQIAFDAVTMYNLVK